MYEAKTKILPLRIAPGRRILVISDIHGNLPYLKGLLDKVGFGPEDELIIDGDFVEKGAYSLETLRYLMGLAQRGNTHLLLGNCDNWNDIFPMGSEYYDRFMRYLLYRKCGLLWDMLNASGLDPFDLDEEGAWKEELARAYPEEWAFLDSLPHAIETEHYVFAHAAVRPGKALRQHTVSELVTCDAFLKQGWRFDKWVVVGHWPVMLYHENIVCANPIIDREAHIISIDGGCVLKDDGQLNALIIPYEGSEDFRWESYDPFPERTVRSAQAGSERSYYIRWGDSRVRVLRRGEEFSRCRHVRTGYEMDILTKYLFTDNEETDCNDCTDYVLPLRPGDRVRVVETTSRGYFVKHDGVSGWYFGQLE